MYNSYASRKVFPLLDNHPSYSVDSFSNPVLPWILKFNVEHDKSVRSQNDNTQLEEQVFFSF